MKGLAWDDQPEKYLELLKQHLAGYGISLEITSELSAFLQKFHSKAEKWDFIVTDIYSPDPPRTQTEKDRVGVGIATRGVQEGLPVFVITKHTNKTETIERLPPGAIVKSKSTLVEWTADDIHQELSRRGIVNRRKLFLIYGKDKEAMGARENLTAFLRGLGLNVEGDLKVDIKTEIAQGLLNKMNGCAAFLALCTPDDDWPDGTWHPRGNVMLEIGIAIGFSHGLDRLTILQRTGPEPKLNATLPSDLHGILTMRFQDSLEAIFPALERRLRELGVEISGASGNRS